MLRRRTLRFWRLVVEVTVNSTSKHERRRRHGLPAPGCRSFWGPSSWTVTCSRNRHLPDLPLPLRHCRTHCRVEIEKLLLWTRQTYRLETRCAHHTRNEKPPGIYTGVCSSVAVRSFHRDEKSYYENVLQYSRSHLMLYPYHLSDYIVTRMRITPFQYYISVMQARPGASRADFYFARWFEVELRSLLYFSLPRPPREHFADLRAAPLVVTACFVGEIRTRKL